MATINVEEQKTIRRLFDMAIRRAVTKGLEEDRVDLEERGYGQTSG